MYLTNNTKTIYNLILYSRKKYLKKTLIDNFDFYINPVNANKISYSQYRGFIFINHLLFNNHAHYKSLKPYGNINKRIYINNEGAMIHAYV